MALSPTCSGPPICRLEGGQKLTGHRRSVTRLYDAYSTNSSSRAIPRENGWRRATLSLGAPELRLHGTPPDYNVSVYTSLRSRSSREKFQADCTLTACEDLL